MKVFLLAIAALAMGAVAARQLFACEIFGAVQGNGQAAIETPEGNEAVVFIEMGDDAVELAKQMFGGNLIEHRANMIVAGDLLYPEQHAAIRMAAAVLKISLVREKGRALHQASEAPPCRQRRENPPEKKIENAARPISAILY